MDMKAADTQVDEALRQARSLGLERLDAQMLLLHVLGRSVHDRAWLMAHGDAPLDAAAAGRFQALCARRLDHEPMAYLLGTHEFYGLLLTVDARVLDPRPDTETLVDWALALLADKHAPTLLDLGTGSGAIALALQHQRPDAQVWALDASAEALAVAEFNARQLKLPVRFMQGHWLHPWPPLSAPEASAVPDAFDLIVSNPPYIRSDDPHLPALRHEPLSALVAGQDGLDDIRQIAQQAPKHLKPGGWLLLEHGWDQGESVADILHLSGLTEIEHRRDLAGHLRCTGARRP